VKFDNDLSMTRHTKAFPRWVIAGVALLLTVLILLEAFWWGSKINAALAIILAITLGGVFYIIVGRLLSLQRDFDQLQEKAKSTEKDAEAANHRLAAVFKLSQGFAEDKDDTEIVSLLLQISVDLLGGFGASFVPIDERGQPLTAIRFGSLPDDFQDAWVEYLASPTVRNKCRTCQNQEEIIHECPLLHSPFLHEANRSQKASLFCLPLRRGEQELGILNLYIPDDHSLDEHAQQFLRSMLDETALALESSRLRKRELATFRQLQSVRRQSDLNGLLTAFLQNVRDTLNADFTLMKLIRDSDLIQDFQTAGSLPENSQAFVDGLIQSVVKSGQPLLIGNVASDPESTQGIKSLLIVPLQLPEDEVMGVILAGNIKSPGFNQRHLVLLNSLSGQVALVIRNYQLLTDLEYQTVMAERARLAREIHDGLAQTLGFLKLQVAQMQSYLTLDEFDRLKESLQITYRTLAEAYLDARHAIDGLRIAPDELGLEGWLELTVNEFQENCDIPIKLDIQAIQTPLASEVQVQLIRIVQEALSNIRKHAHASQIWVTCQLEGGELILEIKDNGCGFSHDEVPGSSRYGLRGMRERAELIGAEFQVISKKGDGTIVILRLPFSIGEVVE